MRLWHYELLSVLPRQQLVAQLRECVAIAKAIHKFGKPNHILVNKVMNYPTSHFRTYCGKVIEEMKRRDYNVSEETIRKLNQYIGFQYGDENEVKVIFKQWHNNRYLTQCYYNLEEKFDCGGIDVQEWIPVAKYMERNIVKLFEENHS